MSTQTITTSFNSDEFDQFKSSSKAFIAVLMIYYLAYSIFDIIRFFKTDGGKVKLEIKYIYIQIDKLLISCASFFSGIYICHLKRFGCSIACCYSCYSVTCIFRIHGGDDIYFDYFRDITYDC